MRLARVGHLFGGEKVIFYFLADGRVDVRELVKDLASEFKTRIELRQIGVRDEARLLAEYEHCGRELCCRTFIKDLQPVTMRMAKLQKTTLDPTKISGRCGRLMCCLRYEDDLYTDLKKRLPKKGTYVRLEEGNGIILGGEVLSQNIVVGMDEGRIVRANAEDILEVLPKDSRPSEEERRAARRGGRRGDAGPPQKSRGRSRRERDERAEKAASESAPTETAGPDSSADSGDADSSDKPRKSRRRRGRRRRKKSPADVDVQGASNDSSGAGSRSRSDDADDSSRPPSSGEGAPEGGAATGSPDSEGERPQKRRRRRGRRGRTRRPRPDGEGPRDGGAGDGTPNPDRPPPQNGPQGGTEG
jgi:hypothetical protein